MEARNFKRIRRHNIKRGGEKQVYFPKGKNRCSRLSGHGKKGDSVPMAEGCRGILFQESGQKKIVF